MVSSESDILKQIVDIVSRHTDLISRCFSERTVSHSSGHAVRNDLHELKTRLERVVKLLIEGNGQPSVITRLALAEQKLDSLVIQMNREDIDTRERIREVLARIEQESEREEESESAKTSGRGYIVASIVAALATIATALLGILPKCN